MGTLTTDDVSKLFPFLGRDRHISVTENDILIGHSWKTYLFPAEKRFNEDAVLSFIKSRGVDCITKICDLETILRGGFQYTDYTWLRS